MRYTTILTVALALLPVGCGDDATAPEVPTSFDVTVTWPYALEVGLTEADWAVVGPADASHAASVLAEGRFDDAGVAILRFTASCRPGDPLTYPQVRLSALRTHENEALAGLCTVSMVLGCTGEARELVVPDPGDPWAEYWDDRTTRLYRGSCGLLP